MGIMSRSESMVCGRCLSSRGTWQTMPVCRASSVPLSASPADAWCRRGVAALPFPRGQGRQRLPAGVATCCGPSASSSCALLRDRAYHESSGARRMARGSVALIDRTSNREGNCSPTAIAFGGRHGAHQSCRLRCDEQDGRGLPPRRQPKLRSRARPGALRPRGLRVPHYGAVLRFAAQPQHQPSQLRSRGPAGRNRLLRARLRRFMHSREVPAGPSQDCSGRGWLPTFW